MLRERGTYPVNCFIYNLTVTIVHMCIFEFLCACICVRAHLCVPFHALVCFPNFLYQEKKDEKQKNFKKY